MKTLYLECSSGISGDMTVGALLDLGVDRQKLEAALNSLQVEGYALQFGRAKKAGIDAFDFDVKLEHPEHPDVTHTHPHHDDGHHHNEEHHHHHEHQHEGEHHHGEHSHHHAHVHRNLDDVLAIIESGDLTPKARELAKKIFHIIAQAEAKAHGLPLEQVHFHEVGAVDSIVDVVGAAVCIDLLAVDRVIVSPLSEGCGHVHCAHGQMPVPVPAVANIAVARKVPLVMTGIPGELVTPTGIAIASAAAEAFQVPSQMNILRIGYGAGKKDLPGQANVLRAYLLEEEAGASGEEVLQMETNIDDQTGETLAFACDLLREEGALDVWTEPIFMKKGRAAYKLCVLSEPAKEEKLLRIIFAHTTSIGVRKSILQRSIMHREVLPVQTRFGQMQVKRCTYQGITKHYVEFEPAKEAAKQHHVTIQQVIEETLSKICQ
ncbi:nickel pincer cofactor biosynthesis protein LarC [Massilimaliae timonensis]|uniref:Pyridinium-3,5-bisthiocarboxylic acid mononucleotide nickel insertion protein n=1 Tax=Massiliimalia timonensis TaxID=1987501 RepID=A0A8J6P589_9FIRM|nr:nickel pincer cofactor biosynthesis protein LarC [Massiliimalia timonensis]MBC8611523.1 nickel pincer cofactor biosynthesis protein LarC [Massiliimalia timonensis]